jgi:actin-related protein
MLEQVYLSGGNTMFPGLLPRLKSELEMSTQLQADVAGAPDRAYGAWCGASMLLSVEQDYLVPRTVTKENYDEFGSILLHLQLLPG